MELQRLGMDIVGGCNLKCVGCPNSTLDRPIRFTTFDDFKIFLHNIDVSHVCFFKLYNFGESFLHPEIGKMISIIPKQKWSVKHIELSTNGQIIDEKKITDVLSNKRVTRFGISCDGNCSAEQYEQLRVGAKWDKLMTFMDMCSRIHSDVKSKAKIYLKIICTGNKPEWERLAKKHKFSIEWLNWRRPPDSIKYINVEKRKLHKPCHYVLSTRTRCFVGWEGSVVPCCCHPKAAVFGNLRTKKFSSIYNGAKRKRFIASMKRGRLSHPVCGNCEIK